MNPSINALRLRQTLMTLILVLVFEGVARKAAPPGLGVPLFLLKDVLVLVMGYFVLQMPPAPPIAFLWKAYKVMLVLFVPLVICTAWHDPLLAVFGAKEYLLYPVVAFATFHGFQFARREEILRFFRRAAVLIIPTTIFAVVQTRLPHDHWLNMSVNGESLEAFSAAGQLRVSSTFSFVAQFCAFLNAESFIIMIALYEWRKKSLLWQVVLLSLIPFLVVGCFITGSRGAVAADTAIVLLAGGLALMKFQVRNVLQVCVIIASLFVLAQLVNYFSPETTAAYTEREHGQLIGFSEEVRSRVFGGLTGLSQESTPNTFFGHGLGVMSNGADTFSAYADSWRTRLWTETDGSSILFEGGWYLAIIWYGFRFYVIFVTARRYLKEVNDSYAVPAAFTQAMLIIIGITGTLGTQPPIAIWWWFSVGTSLLLWWKCVSPPEPEIKFEPPPPASKPRKQGRGRSLYSEALNRRK